jgi:hypothetical protein
MSTRPLRKRAHLDTATDNRIGRRQSDDRRPIAVAVVRVERGVLLASHPPLFGFVPAKKTPLLPLPTPFSAIFLALFCRTNPTHFLSNMFTPNHIRIFSVGSFLKKRVL